MSAALEIASDHPAYTGHFPGFPVLPGAVLLDAALREIASARHIRIAGWTIVAVKFLQVVRPGDHIIVEHSMPGDSTIRFQLRTIAAAVLTGTLTAVKDSAADGN